MAVLCLQISVSRKHRKYDFNCIGKGIVQMDSMMANLIENRASVSRRCSGKCVYFLDSSWKKTRRCKLYEGNRLVGPHKEQEKVVLKIFNDNYMTEDDCDEIIARFKVLDKLARAFNEKTQSRIRILVPDKAIIDRTAGCHNWKGRRRTLSKEEWILVFKKIDSNFRTFVELNGSGNGYQVMDAFVHFVYQQTNCNVAVSKLRGVKQGNGWVLACPRVCSRDGTTGVKDPRKVDAVFEKHECNELCRAFVEDGQCQRLAPSAPVVNGMDNRDPVLFSRLTPSAPVCDDTDFWCTDFVEHSDAETHFGVQDMNNNDVVAVPSSEHCSLPPPYSVQCPEDHRPVPEVTADQNVSTPSPIENLFLNFLHQYGQRHDVNANQNGYS